MTRGWQGLKLGLSRDHLGSDQPELTGVTGSEPVAAGGLLAAEGDSPPAAFGGPDDPGPVSGRR